MELDGLDDTRLRIIDVNDVRHKSGSCHASGRACRDTCMYADLDAYAPLSMDSDRCRIDAQACTGCMAMQSIVDGGRTCARLAALGSLVSREDPQRAGMDNFAYCVGRLTTPLREHPVAERTVVVSHWA